MDYKTKYQEYPLADREYYDTVFQIAFKDTRDLLNLYNAINGTNYTNQNDLEVNTLGNVIYLSMKNDTSFLLDSTMNLYEHQSSFNPNMPLRGLLYFARLYEKYVKNRNINIYSKKLQKLPAPRYIVFYNGTDEQPDVKKLRLSDAFEKPDGCLECEVTMYNVNYGKNQELLKNCRRLEEYAIFIDCVRDHLKRENKQLNAAINKAIDECIDKNILKDILVTQRAEVLSVLLTTFDKELYEKGLKEDAFNDGKLEGIREGIREGKLEGIREGKLEGIREGKLELIKLKLKKGKSITSIAEDMEETEEHIKELMETYLTEKTE